MNLISKSVTFPLSFLLLLSGLLTNSCEKEGILDDPSVRLVFSSDTILFDTVFTGIGSATRHLKVYNNYKRSVEISSVALSGGENSSYRINVDGIPGYVFNNIVLPGGDSIYIFAETTIDPLDSNSPLVVEDSIIFQTNGNIQKIKLLAWGQDVNIIRGKTFQTTRLTAEKPYLIYDNVLVDTGHVLTLDPGVSLHFHRNSHLYVAGSVISEGDHDNPVVFEGARTETAYKNIPGQWEGIRILPVSSGNRFINTRIRNAVNGILVDTPATPAALATPDTPAIIESPALYLANSIIENMTYSGIFARGAVIYSYNTIIANCGYHALALISGGDYTFYHCTIANYWKFSSRRTPSVFIGNYNSGLSAPMQSRPVSVIFANSIIHGYQQFEIGFSIQPDSNFDIAFSHCLLNKPHNLNSGIAFNNCISDIPPGFADSSGLNFRLDESSPAINAGDLIIANLHPFDFEGKVRPFGDGPDIGAYEWHEEE